MKKLVRRTKLIRSNRDGNTKQSQVDAPLRIYLLYPTFKLMCDKENFFFRGFHKKSITNGMREKLCMSQYEKIGATDLIYN